MFSRVSDVGFSIMLQKKTRVFLIFVLTCGSYIIWTQLMSHVSVKISICHDLQNGGATTRAGGGLGVKDNISKLLPYDYRLSDQSQTSAMKQSIELLNGMKTAQDDPHLLNTIRGNWLRPPSKEEYNLNNPEKKDFSMGQTAVVDALLEKKRGGFFVECGALDGETRSNTLFFERERGWSGLLIEADPLNYRQLIQKHRKAYSAPVCLGVRPYPSKMSFHQGSNRGRLINGKEALEWIRKASMKPRLTDIQCLPMYSLLKALNQTRVDYFSLDVEGVEFDVLQTIPWDHVDIQVMTIEFVHLRQGKAALKEYVENLGYETVTEISRADWLANDFVFKKKSVEKKKHVYKR